MTNTPRISRSSRSRSPMDTRTPVRQGTSRELLGHTSRAEECAGRKRDPRTSTRLLHDHDHDHLHDATTRVGALVTRHTDESSPQWVPARTPTVHWGRYDGRPWVARPHVQSAKRLTMPHHENTTNERCSDKHIRKFYIHYILTGIHMSYRTARRSPSRPTVW